MANTINPKYAPGIITTILIILHKVDKAHTDNKSTHVYYYHLWKPCMKKSIPVNHKKKVRNIPLQGLIFCLRRGGYFNLVSDFIYFLPLINDYLSIYYGCIIYNLQLQSKFIYYNMKRQTFLLPQKIVIEIMPNQIEKQSVSYYSDCVFNPFVHYFKLDQFQIVQKQEKQTIILNFQFLLQAIESFPKIVDNIGILKLGKKLRYGILVTKQKQGLFLSIID